ncbi:alpha/beta fold hydrolase [Alteromonas sp. a30]|uniref:alpha/beta fold hydrolase n=1 Tax=Alteromonas sp. a30 TaxID=2730917 RepID=UPI00227E602C|nr:alpha/beta hydrolase [Alteromonas sp. a30]MCY7296160.1 alpha/beta hydrolase [Alteromonas sp. a30]
MPAVPYHSEKVYDCNGIQLACDSFGDPENPVILLIMGLATQLIHWDEPFCEQLAAEGYWVIRFDNRDIGHSQCLHHLGLPNFFKLAGNHYFNTHFNAPYSLQDMANDSVHLLDALGVEKAHIIGASMGGMIAQLVAIHHPERVLSLTSIMSATGDKKLMRPTTKMSLFMMRPPPREANRHIAHTMKMWRILHGKDYPFEEERVRNIVTTSLKRGFYPSGVMRQLSAIISAKDRSPLLKNLSIPTLIFHGEKDPLVPVANGLATAAAIPGATLKIIKGMGHTIPNVVWQQLISDVLKLIRLS